MIFSRSIVFVSLILSSVICSPAKKLNIVLIMADDVGYECFSAYGSKEFSTPRLDALAAKGMHFDHCHSVVVQVVGAKRLVAFPMGEHPCL